MQVSRDKKKIITAIVILLGIAILWHYIFGAKEPPKPMVAVTIKSAIEKNVVVTFQTIGNVEPFATVDVKSMVTGQLVRVGFKEGEMVEKNQVLFEIDQRPFQAALDQANANLLRDQATLANNKLQVERNAPLLKKAYVSKQDFDTLNAIAKSAQATVNADKAAVANAQLQLDYALIRAPISGKTGSISLKLGSVIKANDTTALVTINQITPIYVNFSISQDKLPVIQSNLQQGKNEVSAIIANTTKEVGNITFVDNAVAANTGTILLKATFQNAKQMLWPGQFVNVNVPLEHYTNAVLVPTLALMTAQDGFYVIVVDDQDIAHLRYVKPGAAIDDQTIILDGLKAGEKVIIAGQLRVTDGMQVKVVTPKKTNS